MGGENQIHPFSHHCDNDARIQKDSIPIKIHKQTRSNKVNRVHNIGNQNSATPAATVREMKAISFNLRSITSRDKRLALSAVLHANDTGILLGQETKLTEHFTDGEIAIPGYSVAVRTDRKAKKLKNAGGGTIIFIKDGISYHGAKSHNLGKNVQISEVRVGDYYLYSVYRAPKSTNAEDKALAAFIRKNGHRRGILTGDFNLPSIRWDKPNFEVNILNKELTVYHAFKDIGWRQHCLVKSRHPKAHEKNNNIIDLLFTAEDDFLHGNVVTSPTLFPLDFSDHKSVVFSIMKVQIQRQKTKLVHDMKRANFDLYDAHLGSKDLINKTACPVIDLNDKNTVIELAMRAAFDEAVPKKTINTDLKAPWITRELRREHNQIKSLRKGANIFPHRENDYFMAISKHKDNLKKARVEYEKRLIEGLSKDNKCLYKYMKDIRGNGKGSIKALRKKDNSTTGNEGEIANILNDQYKAFFNPETNPDIDWSKGHENEGFLRTILVTKGNVVNAIKKLKAKYSPGQYGIIPIMLKKGPNTSLYLWLTCLTHP